MQWYFIGTEEHQEINSGVWGKVPAYKIDDFNFFFFFSLVMVWQSAQLKTDKISIGQVKDIYISASKRILKCATPAVKTTRSKDVKDHYYIATKGSEGTFPISRRWICLLASLCYELTKK